MSRGCLIVKVRSIEEGERRRTHVRTAIAEKRLEAARRAPRHKRFLTPVCAAGIEAGDLVTAYKMDDLDKTDCADGVLSCAICSDIREN